MAPRIRFRPHAPPQQVSRAHAAAAADLPGLLMEAENAVAEFARPNRQRAPDKLEMWAAESLIKHLKRFTPADAGKVGIKGRRVTEAITNLEMHTARWVLAGVLT